MSELNFSEKDVEKVVEFLNLVAKKAKFEMDTSEIIKYFGLLSYMQKGLLPKIEGNIMEVQKVTKKDSPKKGS